MRVIPRLVSRSAATLALTLILASAAAAQQGAGAAPADTNGPLVLTPIPTSVVFSPDEKVTTINHTTAALTGFYVGRRYDERLFLGAGGYWLANQHDAARMFYGGFIGGWRIAGGDRASLTARALAGVGEGTAYVTFQAEVPVHQGPHTPPTFQTVNRQAALTDGFLVFEPEVDFTVGLTRSVRVNFGAGYRATTASQDVNDLFRGATGTIGVQFDIGR